MVVYEAVYYTAHHFGVAGEGHVELKIVTGSATLLQFGGAGRKLALTAAGGLRRFKE